MNDPKPSVLPAVMFVQFLQSHCEEVASILGLKLTWSSELSADAPADSQCLMTDFVFTRGPKDYLTIYSFVNQDGYFWFTPDHGEIEPCFDYPLPSPWRAAVIEELIQMMSEHRDVGDYVKESSRVALYKALRVHRGNPTTFLEAVSQPLTRLSRACVHA